MEPSRRKLLLTSVAIFPTISGCGGFRRQDRVVTELDIQIINSCEKSRDFHCFLESQNGVSEWETFELRPKAKTEKRIETNEDERYVKFHGVVGKHHLTYDLDDFGTGNICPEFVFWALPESDGGPKLLRVAGSGCQPDD
jgi:hypothetical protein